MKKKLFVCSVILSITVISFRLNAQWIHTSGTYINHVRALAIKDTNIFAATPDGIFMQTMTKNNWISVNEGLTTTDILSLVVNGADIYAGTFGKGVFRSTNNGTNWAPVNNGLTINNVNTLLVNINHNQTGDTSIFAGTYDYLLGGGIFKSTNNGTNWIKSDSGLSNFEVRALTIKDTILFAGTAGGVFRSTNNGISWTEMNNGFLTLFVSCFQTSGDYLFAGTFGGGVYRSSNNGESWQAINMGLTNYLVNALAVCQQSLMPESMKLFVGTGWSGVFISHNNGDSWSAVNTGMTSSLINSFAVSDTYIYSGTDSGLWRRSLSELTEVALPTNRQLIEFQLDQNYPNPFNPSTTIKYQIPAPPNLPKGEASQLVTLKVYDVLGREVTTLVNGVQSPGNYSVQFGINQNIRLTSGVYFYTLKAGNYVQVRKMILLK